ncbi:MAG: ATP-binding protein [Candidatus Diapherotrites archaeon]|nr:ATP-binding protein [Candidatus Diapherotrites archaeon]
MVNDYEIKEKLELLESPGQDGFFIGMKKSAVSQGATQTSLFVGKTTESSQDMEKISLDSSSPHVVFICGMRGSGKSYSLGVIAEELALKNKNIGIILIDPIGVFWSMKYPNSEEKEIKRLASWELMPKGVDGVKVFVPLGASKKVPKETIDRTFSVSPAELTVDEWCLTFGMDRFSPGGLLIEKVLERVREGYKTKTGTAPAKGNSYGIEDMLSCIDESDDITSARRGYKQETRRSVMSRLEAAKSWGIFSSSGTPLSELSREGQISVVDTSFLEENVAALLIGILAKKILASRKLAARSSAMSRLSSLEVNELMESDIPPTWLFLDEAHTLIPSGTGKTAATDALIEYVKQGRRPGCSLVFATQQPSAIDMHVLSQVDIMMVHKLIFDDDIKAVYKRMPCVMPKEITKQNIIKSLPVGISIIGDRREETSRAFLLEIRPRLSQHEGRDMQTGESTQVLGTEGVKDLVETMLLKKLEQSRISEAKLKELISTLNKRYNVSLTEKKIIKSLVDSKQAVFEGGFLMLPGKQRFALSSSAKKGAVDENPSGVESEAEVDTKLKLISKKIRKKGLSGEPDEKNDGGLDSGKNVDSVKTILEKENKKPASLEKSLSSALETVNSASGNEFDVVSENTEMVSFVIGISKEKVRRIIEKVRRKKTFGVFGDEEEIEEIDQVFLPVWKIQFNHFREPKKFRKLECFVDALNGEFLFYGGPQKGFFHSSGFAVMASLNYNKQRVLWLLSENLNGLSFSQGKVDLAALSEKIDMKEESLKSVLNQLIENGLVEKNEEKDAYFLSHEISVPKDPDSKIVSSPQDIIFMETEPEGSFVKHPETRSKDIALHLRQIWPNVSVKKVETVFRPMWRVTLDLLGRKREVYVDAVTGKTYLEKKNVGLRKRIE